MSDPFSLRNLMNELAELGASPQIMVVVTEIVAKCLGREMHPDVSAAVIRRAKDRERKRHPEGHSTEFHGKPNIYYNNNTPGGGRGVGKGEPISAEFDALWKRYPRKKSKGKAEKTYQKARKIASFEEISAGVDRLVAEKRDPEFWPYFATWLNAKGWLDEPSNVVSFSARTQPRWVDVQADYKAKYGADAFKRYQADLAGEGVDHREESHPASV